MLMYVFYIFLEKPDVNAMFFYIKFKFTQVIYSR